MRVTLLDDWQHVARQLPVMARMAAHEVHIFTDSAADAAELRQRLQQTEALLIVRERSSFDRALLQALPRLRLISAVGPVPVDRLACAELGITLCSRTVTSPTASVTSYATAELTWGLLLAAMRRIPQEMTHLRSGGWQTRAAVGGLLRDRTLGLVGYGRVAAIIAGYGRAFGMRVITWGREGALQRARADGVDVVPELMELFSTADIVSLHLALNDETRGIVRREHLAEMREDGCLVNTGRARLVAPGALLEALRAGRPGAAALDVFDCEPVREASDPLLSLPNVVATPHLGYLERRSIEAMFETMFEQVLAFDRGAPINVIVRGDR